MSKKVILETVIDLITKIFGKNALSKTIGTRTNVITLPDSEIKRVIKNDLNIAKANDEQLEVFRDRAEKLIPDVPKMNDQELLTFKGNLQRYYDKTNPPKAEVFDFQTKTKVPKSGIEQLETDLGIPSGIDPNSPLGRVALKTKQIAKEGKDLAKEFGMEDQLKKGIDDLAQSQIQMSKMQDEGLVRATAREIMDRDIKSGKLQIPKEEMDVVLEYSSVNDPLDIWRKYYGEDALEQLDSMIPDFYQMRTSTESADAATKKFTFEPKAGRPQESYTKEEFEEIIKKGFDTDDPPETPEFATGGRVGFAKGKLVLDLVSRIVNQIKSLSSMDAMKEMNKVIGKQGKYKNLSDADVEKINDQTQAHIFSDVEAPALQADEILEVPEPFKAKFKQEFLAHDQMFGRRTGDNKVDAQEIAEQVAEMQGRDYNALGYTEQMNLYDRAFNYLGLLDRTRGAMKEAKGRTLQASGGLAYLMGL
jgi:hypothetical protein